MFQYEPKLSYHLSYFFTNLICVCVVSSFHYKGVSPSVFLALQDLFFLGNFFQFFRYLCINALTIRNTLNSVEYRLIVIILPPIEVIF